MTSFLRPDEEVAEKEVKKAKERTSEVKSVLETTANAATGIVGGSMALKVLPFLSEYIPLELAKKGIDKVAPTLGRMLDQGLKQGLTLQSGLEFLKGEFIPEEGKKMREEKKKNEVGEVSQELQDFIEQHVQGGKSPDHAAALAMVNPKFMDMTRQIEKQTGKPFTASIRELYEGKAVNQQGQEQGQPQQAQAPQGQQQGQINPKLQAAYQKLGAYFGG